jgi:hypothetical protein
LDQPALQDAWKRFEVLGNDAAKRHSHGLTKRALLLQTMMIDESPIIRTSSDIPSFYPKSMNSTNSISACNDDDDVEAPFGSSNTLEVSVTRKKRMSRRKSHVAVAVSIVDADLAMQRETLNTLINLHANSTHLPLSLPDLITANYVCDFGTIVLGASKKRIIRLVSLSSTIPLSWQLDTKLASIPDLSWDATKGKLALGEKTELTVKFQPTKNSYNLGPCTLVGSICLKGSISVRVYIVANICIPEVKVSRYDVDFGNVLLGQCQQQEKPEGLLLIAQGG